MAQVYESIEIVRNVGKTYDFTVRAIDRWWNTVYAYSTVQMNSMQILHN